MTLYLPRGTSHKSHILLMQEEGCGITDLLLMRNASVLLNADVQTVDADRKRKVAVVERKKIKRLLLCFKEAES